MNAQINRRLLVKALGLGSAGLAAGFTLDRAGLHRIADVAAQDGPIAIEYWHRSSGAGEEAWQNLADMFNAEFGDRITVTPVFQGGIQELNQKVRAAAVGGEMPGALMGDDYDITQYAYNDILVPLDDFINDPAEGFSATDLADFLPNQLNRHKLDIYGGSTMAFPQGFSAFAMFWNVELVQSTGFDEPPTTWAEFGEFLRAFAAANPGSTPWITCCLGDRFISIMKTYGVEWMKEGSSESNFDAPEVLEILTWFKSWYDEGLLAVSNETSKDSFTGGLTPVWLDSSGNAKGLPELITFTLGGGMPPQGPNVTAPITETYGPINCIPKTSDEKQLAGWTWLKWLSTPEAMAPWIATTGYFPSRVSVANSPELSAFYEQFPVASKMNQEVAPNASILMPSPALTEVRGTITANIVNEVLLGRLSPEEGVQKLKAEADVAITNAATASAANMLAAADCGCPVE